MKPNTYVTSPSAAANSLLRTTSKRLLKYCATVCLGAYAAYGSPILYTFSATTKPTLGSPAHPEFFRLVMPDFLPVVTGGPVVSLLTSDPGVISCTPCRQPPVKALHFLSSITFDSIQFQDSDGVGRFYMFPANALSSLGTFNTQPGINVNVGKLVVSSVPEPSTIGMLAAGITALLAAGAARRRLRRRDRGGSGSVQD